MGEIIKHIKNKKGEYIGTFIAKTDIAEGPLNQKEIIKFGWSKYNIRKEQIPFNKKVGITEAIKTFGDVLIDPDSNILTRNDVMLRNKDMSNEAFKFIIRVHKAFGKVPDNIKLNIRGNFVKDLLYRLMNEIRVLRRQNKEMLSLLKKTYLNLRASSMSHKFSEF